MLFLGEVGEACESAYALVHKSVPPSLDHRCEQAARLSITVVKEGYDTIVWYVYPRVQAPPVGFILKVMEADGEIWQDEGVRPLHKTEGMRTGHYFLFVAPSTGESQHRFTSTGVLIFS